MTDITSNGPYKKTTLDNGLRILTCTMPQTHSISLSVFVGAGSRYESPEQAGISHVIEHMCFKGTEKRPTAKEITESIEGVGGLFNASTDHEMTVYWCKVARPHFNMAVDVVLDMLRNPKFDPGDLERERKVILEELNMVNDSPQSQVDLLIDEVIWPDQPLGRDIGGTKESVNAITRTQALEYMHRQYGPANAVISVAGDISHEEAVERLSPYLRDWALNTPQSLYPAQDGQDGPRMKVGKRKTEQTHLSLAVRGLSLIDPDRYALDLLGVILGEGMSSRLFQELREKQGLAYDVHSYVHHFLDSGAFLVYAGVEHSKAKGAIQSILEEMGKLRDGIPEAELTKARELSKGRLLLRMEDTRAVTGWMGAQELLVSEVKSVEEVVSNLETITTGDLQRIARRLVVGDKLNLAVVGPVRSEKGLQRLLKV